VPVPVISAARTAHAVDRIVARRGCAHRVHAVEAKLGELAGGLLEGRPVLLLLGTQRQPGLERRQTRLTECPPVLHAWAPALGAVGTRETFLSVNHRRAHYRESSGSDDDALPHGSPPNSQFPAQ
jgi:hypothetical protein